MRSRNDTTHGEEKYWAVFVPFMVSGGVDSFRDKTGLLTDVQALQYGHSTTLNQIAHRLEDFEVTCYRG